MAIGSVSSTPELVQSHHKHIHKPGTPVTKQDPATNNSVPGPATSSTDKALTVNQQQPVATTTPTPTPPTPAATDTTAATTTSSSTVTATSVGTLVDKKA